jgi:hypothetical protein
MLRHFKGNEFSSGNGICCQRQCLANHVTVDLALQRMVFTLHLNIAIKSLFSILKRKVWSLYQKQLYSKKVKACSIYFVFEPYILFVKQPGVTLFISSSLVKFIIRVVLQYLFWSINIYFEKTRFSCFLKN